MGTPPINNDLPYSNGIPGTYVKLDLTGAGAAKDDSQRRALLLGYKLSTGTYGADLPVRVTSQSDANTYFGRGSDLARMFAAFQSQIGPGAADIYCCGIAEPAGTASRYQIVLDFSTGSTAGGAGNIDVTIAGYTASLGVVSGDTLTTISAALAVQINKLTDAPATAAAALIGAAASGTDGVNITYRHLTLTGEDLPIKVNITGSTNLRASIGWAIAGAGSSTLLFATSSAAAGSCVLNVGETTITSAIAGIETAAVIAANLVTAVNAGSYPVTARHEGATGKVHLYYATDRDVRRATCRVIKTDGTANDTTVNAVAAGSYAYLGTATSNTPGAGNPTLTTALVNIGAAQAFGTWVTGFAANDPWAASPVYTSTGTLSSHIETYANGYYQKDQVLFLGLPQKLAQAGAYPAGTSPALTASCRYMVIWCPGSPQQGYELAAHAAAVYLDQNYAAKNYDGLKLVSKTATVPLLIPHLACRPSADDKNAAMMSYYMTPIEVDSQNRLSIVRGRTTSNDANADLWEWSTIKQLSAGRVALRERLISLFSGKSYRTSTPKTPNTVTASGIGDAIYVLLKEQDDLDLFDDAASVKDAIQVAQNATVRTRLDVFVPWKIVRCLHQISATLSPQ